MDTIDVILWELNPESVKGTLLKFTSWGPRVLEVLEKQAKSIFFPLGILRAYYYILNFLEVDTVDKWKWDLELKHRDKKERVGPRDTQDDG